MHHHEILTEALTRFAHDYGARERDDILKELKRLGGDGKHRPPADNTTPAPLVSKESDDGPAQD